MSCVQLGLRKFEPPSDVLVNIHHPKDKLKQSSLAWRHRQGSHGISIGPVAVGGEKRWLFFPYENYESHTSLLHCLNQGAYHFIHGSSIDHHMA